MLFTFLPVVLTSPAYHTSLLIALAFSIKATSKGIKSTAYLFFFLAVIFLLLATVELRGFVPTI